ncbi:hypothetical protein LCM19_11490 [Qipengyuania flava]|nr:hypothetical protein [Qipengyuania flava]
MGENTCRIARVFGEGEKRAVFYLEQAEPSASATWMAAGTPFEDYWAGRTTSFAFGPGGDSRDFKLQDMTLGKWGTAVSHGSRVVAPTNPEGRAATGDQMRGLPMLDAEGAIEIEKFSVSQSHRPTVLFELGGMKDALTAMNVCMADLVQHWGFDVEEQKAVKSGPKFTNLRDVYGRLLYHIPNRVMEDRSGSPFQTRLTVHNDGFIKECFVNSRSAAEGLDEDRHPCDIFEKYAKFEPALIADGSPVESYFTAQFIFKTSP